MKTIAVVGDPVLDQIYHTTDSLVAGGKMLGRFFGVKPGGTTANFACAASAFGLQPSLIGRVAANGEGDLHRDALEAANVNVDLLEAHNVEKGAHTVIAIGPDGEKSLIYIPFPEVDNAQVDLQILQNHDMTYVMAADIDRLGSRVADTTTEICVDVDAAAGLSPAAFRSVAQAANVLFINDVGFKKLMGKEPDLAAVEALVSGRLTCVCCTGGAGTSFGVQRNRDGGLVSLAIPALPATVVDTTGAGDCFNAAFLARRAEGAGLDDIMAFAMAAGALATEKTGAREAIPTRAQALERMAK